MSNVFEGGWSNKRTADYPRAVVMNMQIKTHAERMADILENYRATNNVPVNEWYGASTLLGMSMVNVAMRSLPKDKRKRSVEGMIRELRSHLGE